MVEVAINIVLERFIAFLSYLDAAVVSPRLAALRGSTGAIPVIFCSTSRAPAISPRRVRQR